MSAEIRVATPQHSCLVNITREVSAEVRASGITDGAVVVFIPHTTAGVTIQENADPDVVFDLLGKLERVVPWSEGYAHAEGNSAAHIKASMCGSSVTVIVNDGQLQLGTWQGIYFCEFDGPRHRRVWLQFLRA